MHLLLALAAITGAQANSSADGRVQVLCGKSALVSPFVLYMAQREAEAVLRKGGIELEWIHSSAPGAPAPPLLVLFRSATSYPIKSKPEALGVTFVSDGSPGRVSVLFCDRLEALAGRGAPEALGRALGRAMAHEISHALKETPRHSPSGLLRPAIARSRWTAPCRVPFYLSPQDAAEIRVHLEGR